LHPLSYSKLIRLCPGLVILFFFFSSFLFAEAQPVKYDSVYVKTLLPEREKEKKVFADTDLKIKKKEAEAQDGGSWAKFKNWLSDNFFGGAGGKMIDLLIWILVAAGLAIIIWLLTRTDFVTFLRGKPKQSEFSFEDLGEDIKGIDFDSRIAKAFSEADFRLAIRWHYLKQLNLLNEKGFIIWESHKTNIEYTKELGKTKFREGFVELSHIYDYIWYGEYAISEGDYKKYAERFKTFEEQLKAAVKKNV